MKISVIIPCYNHQDYILEAVNSVLNQTHKNLELIIIDDGSSDHSLKILKKIDDSRINLISQNNKGAHAAINRGLELASGDYISILNSDDIFDENRLAFVLERMLSENADFASTWIEVIDCEGNKVGVKKAWENMLPWEHEGHFIIDSKSDDYLTNLLFSNFISTTSNMMFKRSIIQSGYKMRAFRFVHDWDFALRVANEYHCINIEEPLIKYRIHNSNTINSNQKWMLYEIMLVLAANIDKVGINFIRHDNIFNQVESLLKFSNLLAYQGNERLFITFYSHIHNLKNL